MTNVILHDEFYAGIGEARDKLWAKFAPTSNDRAASARRGSVDVWLSNYHSSHGTFTLSNESLSGFQIRDWDVRGRSVFQTILDPRGFYIRVPMSNFNDLLHHSIIQNGEIQALCRWGLSGSGHYLLAEHTPAYDDALRFTRLQRQKVSTREIKPGYIVALRNGLIAEYLGLLYTVQHTHHGLVFRPRKTHHFKIPAQSPSPYSLYLSPSPKVSEILSRSEVGLDAAVDCVIDLIEHTQRYLPFRYFISTVGLMSLRDMRMELHPTEINQSQRNFVTIDESGYYHVGYVGERQVAKSMISMSQIDPAPLQQGRITTIDDNYNSGPNITRMPRRKMFNSTTTQFYRIKLIFHDHCLNRDIGRFL